MKNVQFKNRSNDERKRAVTMLLHGATQQEVATALGVHQTTVHRLQGRLVQFGNTNDRPRSVRKVIYKNYAFLFFVQCIYLIVEQCFSTINKSCTFFD
jgi:hypothetical protein